MIRMCYYHTLIKSKQLVVFLLALETDLQVHFPLVYTNRQECMFMYLVGGVWYCTGLTGYPM